jgi:hypothetical protein
MGSDSTSAVLLDPVRWEEREARRSVRDEALPRCQAAAPPARDPRDVALEWIADRETRFQAGEALHRADLAYVLVLATRHKISLTKDFQTALRSRLE